MPLHFKIVIVLLLICGLSGCCNDVTIIIYRCSGYFEDVNIMIGIRRANMGRNLS